MEPVQCGLTTGGTTKAGFLLRRRARLALEETRYVGTPVQSVETPMSSSTIRMWSYCNSSSVQIQALCMTPHGQECVRNSKSNSIRRLALQETMGFYPSRFLMWTSQERTTPTAMTQWAQPLLPPPLPQVILGTGGTTPYSRTRLKWLKSRRPIRHIWNRWKTYLKLMREYQRNYGESLRI